MTHSYCTELYPCFEWDDEPRTWEIEVVLEMTSPGRPGKLSGPPEDCYPAEGPEWEVESIYLRASESKFIKVELTYIQFCDLFGDDRAHQILEAAEEEAGHD